MDSSTGLVALMTAPAVIPKTDPIQEARDHIRVVVRNLARMNGSWQAYVCDDDFGQPNGFTDAIEELGLALGALSGVGIGDRLDAEIAASGLGPVSDQQIAATVAAVKARVAR